MQVKIVEVKYSQMISWGGIECELQADRKKALRSLLDYLIEHDDIIHLSYCKKDPYKADVGIKFSNFEHHYFVFGISDVDNEESNLRINLVATTNASEKLDESSWQEVIEYFCTILGGWQYTDDVSEVVFSSDSEKLSNY